MADTGIDEEQLRSVLEQWTVGLADEPGRTTAVRGRILRRRRRRAIGSVGLAAAVLVAAVVVVGSVGGTASPQPAPPVKRPTPAPALAFPTVFAGGTVAGQAAGVGAGEQTVVLTWPAASNAKVYYRCHGSVDDGFTISVPGYDSVGTVCGSGELTGLDLSSSKLVAIPSGARVVMTVDTAGDGLGAWSVAVVDTDPHWVDVGLTAPEKTFEGRKLATSLRGSSGGSSESFRIDKTDDDAVIVLECSQAGDLTLLLNTNEAATVTCPAVPWSLQRVELSPAELAGMGWVAGQKVTLAVRANDAADGPRFGGILVYAK